MRSDEEWKEKYADADDSDERERCTACGQARWDWELDFGLCNDCGLKPAQCRICLIGLSLRDLDEEEMCGACAYRRDMETFTERNL